MPKNYAPFRRSLIMFLASAIACAKDQATAPEPASPDDMLGSVIASPPVTVLAVGGTQQISVSATSLTGTAITAFDSVLYRLNSLADTLRVRLSNDGRVTALAPSTAAITLNVFAFKHNAAKGYRILFQVTATEVPGVRLSIQPVPPDSAKLAAGSTKTIVPVLSNPTTGASVASPVMRYTVKAEDATRIAVYAPGFTIPGTSVFVSFTGQPSAGTNQIIPRVGEGSAWIYASVNAYGTLLTDSVLYTFSYPYALTLSSGKTNLAVTSTFSNQIVTLAPGATVTFSNTVPSTDPLTIAYSFDQPAAVTAATPPATVGGSAGDVAALKGGQTSARKFLSAGTYKWTATAAGGPEPWAGQIISGTIVIK